MGQVYLAHDTLLDRAVAVKFLAGVSPDEGQRERFRIEARAVARLQHPNIVAIHRIGEVQRHPYLVSELVRGESLDRLPRPLPWERVLTLGIGLARGLAAAHRQGVLHRDIKPANAMLTEEGEVKLLDFGVAKLLDMAVGSAEPVQQRPSAPAVAVPEEGEEEATLPSRQAAASGGSKPASEPASEPVVEALADTDSLTATGALVGTPRYMAPEAWRGEPATPRSDVYSLGVLLYELCAGHAPFHGLGMGELAQAVQSQRIPPLVEVVPGVEPRFSALVERCLEREPARRFSSGDMLREALEALREEERGGPVAAERPYPGLSTFTAEERSLFFGRAAEVRMLVDRLRAEPFVLVAGDSGVGKSSLCRAGVVPRVLEGALGGEWEAAALVPGRQPVGALAAVLAPRVGAAEAELAGELRAEPQGLERRLRAHLRGRGLLLLVDQLEELLTLAEVGEARAFAECLGALAQGVPGVRVLATVRGDFLTRLAVLPGLGEVLQGALYLLRPLSESGLREAIVGPARACGVAFESEALVEALVAAGRAEGGLPLLQFALAELWEGRNVEQRVVPAAALEAIGGVSGALARHAEGVLASLLPAQRAAARRLLLRLVTAEGTRARRTLAELVVGGTEADARAALEALVRGRLLVARESEGEATYELAHEALITGWDVLRGWLAGDVERRAARQRLERAAAEWERLGRQGDALWGARLLAEVAALQQEELGPREVAFLAASRRAVRRRKLLALGAVLALPLAAALAYGGNLLLLRLQTEREVAGYIASAQRLLESARQQNAEVERLRQQAFAAYDAGQEPRGEELWAQAYELTAAARTQGYEPAHRELERAWLRDPSRPRTRRLLAGVLYERLLLAERDHQHEQLGELRHQLELYDDTGEYRRQLQAPARLELETLPAGASVLLERYREEDGRMHLSEPRALGTTPLKGVELEPGSYRLRLRGAERPEVLYPLLLARGEHLRLRLPLPASVPEGYVYVPPGRFLFGAADDEQVRRNFLRTQPQHEVRTGGFLIARHEVTHGEWLQFLRALPPEERARRRPRAKGHFGSIEVTEQPNGLWQLTLQSQSRLLAAQPLEGQRLRYLERTRRAEQDWLRFPVSGISWEDAQAYVAWLDRSGRLPRARLCEVHEWQRAALGADSRLFPHGNRLDPDDANFDATYGRRTLAFGPDEVGSHPLSHSPFGVADLAGNVWEWMRLDTSPHEALYGGGSFYQDVLTSRSDNLITGEPAQRSPLIGLRVCTAPPVPDPPLP